MYPFNAPSMALRTIRCTVGSTASTPPIEIEPIENTHPASFLRNATLDPVIGAMPLFGSDYATIAPASVVSVALQTVVPVSSQSPGV